MVLDLKAKILIPMHWGTFPLGTDTFEEPIKRLEAWYAENTTRLRSQKNRLLKFGQSFCEAY